MEKNKSQYTLAAVVALLIPMLPAQADDANPLNSVSTRNKEYMQEKGGRYQNSKYVYCNDKDIKKELKKQKNNDDVSICSPDVSSNRKVKNVKVVVDSTKDIKVKGADKVDIGTVTTNKNVKNQEIDITVNTTNIESR